MPAVRDLRGRARLVAAVDVDRDHVDAFCREHQVPAGYTDLHEMLDQERPDLVVIATPPALHVEQSLAAMAAGAWVLCEKPLAGSLEDLDRLIEAEGRHGVSCASVLQWRFGPVAQRLKHLIDDGALGRPLLGVSLTSWYRDPAYYAVPWRGTWGSELGGATLSQGVHALDLLLWLYGPWAQVRGAAETLDREIEVEDVSAGIVAFASGAIGTVVSSVLSPREESYLRLDLQRATVELRHLYHYGNQDWTVTPAPGHDAVATLLDGVDEGGSLHAGQLRDVLDAMDEGRPPQTAAAQARGALEFVTALYKAARTGETVQAGSVVPGDPFYAALHGSRPPADAEEVV